MLVGGDLGFWFRLVVGAFTVLFPPVIGLVVRHKWRRAVARREEIKRLCAMASKEAELAELESTAGYSYGYSYNYGYVEGYGGGNDKGFGYKYGGGDAGEVEVQMPAEVSRSWEARTGEEVPEAGRSSQKTLYPCALCSSLTGQKCSRCKAVYYCSGKCQITHWRQGHKDECRPYNPTQKNDMGVASLRKVSKLEENNSHGNCHETEEDSMGIPVETSDAETAFSDSGLPAVHDGKDDSEMENHPDDSGDHPSFRSGSNQLSEVNDVKLHSGPANIGQPERSASKNPISVSSFVVEGTHCTSSQIKLSSAGGGRGRATSALGATSSMKSSLCEPSMSSSGFWEGKLVRSRCRADAPDDTSHCCSSEPDECSVYGSQTTLCSAAKNVALREPQPVMIDTSKSTDGNIHATEGIKGNPVSREPPKSIPERVSNVKASVSSSRNMSGPAEHILPACDPTFSVIEGRIKPSDQPSLISEKLNFESDPRVSSLNRLESKLPKSVTSKEAGTPLTSNKGRHSVESTKAVKGCNLHAGAACSSELHGHQQNAKHPLKTSVRKVVDVFKTSTPTWQNTIGPSSDTLGKHKGLFPYELFVKLYNWNKVEFHPCGLVNCGNSCYANAVLQCLAFTPPLTSYFLQGLHSKSCKRKNWCFTCEFESLVLKAKDGTSPLSPIRIISHLQNIGSHLGHGKEEDAHEFLRYAIDAMQFTCLKEAGMKESGSLEEGTTLIGLTFGGYLRSKIECMRCGFRSERQERMMDLTVEIDGEIGTLEEALKQFTRAETLDGDNKYLCGRCKSYEKARKKLKVQEAPNVLTIALKRYQCGKFGKLNKPIQYPEILNLAPYMCGTSDKSPIYRLYGVIVHLDSMNAAYSGHYVCYIKNIQNKWFKADDSMVKMVELEKVLQKGAYMLLYARCSPRAPRLIRNSVVPRDPKIPKHHTCKSRTLSAGSWGVSTSEGPSNGDTCYECINSIHPNLRPRGAILEDDSCSDNSSFFSEAGSNSTDSSNRDSTCTDEHFDCCEMGVCCNGPWRSSSDSETSSSSSSPSPLFTRQSPLADTDRYASETSGSYADNTNLGLKGHGYRSSLEASDDHFSHPDLSTQFRKSASRSSSRETEANGLGRVNPFGKVKSGLSFRRSASERTGHY